MHESDTEQIAVPFSVYVGSSLFSSDLTTPGLALGEGQRVKINEEAYSVRLQFDLTNGQYINLSEVTYMLEPHDAEKSDV